MTRCATLELICICSHFNVSLLLGNSTVSTSFFFPQKNEVNKNIVRYIITTGKIIQWIISILFLMHKWMSASTRDRRKLTMKLHFIEIDHLFSISHWNIVDLFIHFLLLHQQYFFLFLILMIDCILRFYRRSFLFSNFP